MFLKGMVPNPMNDYIKLIDDLPLIVKMILALPGIDGIAYGLYRLFKGLEQKNTLLVIAGIVWLVGGIFFLWIIDLYQLVMHNRITFLAGD